MASRTQKPPNNKSAPSDCVPDGLPRRDGSVEPHEGPQRRPSATIGRAKVSWMYACISWMDSLL